MWRPAILLLACLAAPLAAQDQADEGASVLPGLLDQLGGAAAEAVTPPAGDVLFPDLPENFVADDQTLAAIQGAVRDYYAYRTQGYAHRELVFRWQLASSRIIFWVVIGIVLAGLYFSWMQFHAGLRPRPAGSPAPEAQPSSTVKLGQLEVSSPILGVIILSLSLAFFYLYLRYVYPITDAF